MLDDWLDKLFPNWPKMGKRKAESRKNNHKSNKSVTVCNSRKQRMNLQGRHQSQRPVATAGPAFLKRVSFLALLQQVTGSPKVLNCSKLPLGFSKREVFFDFSSFLCKSNPGSVGEQKRTQKVTVKEFKIFEISIAI